MSVIWWILGLLGLGAGVAYVYSKSAGKNVPIARACVADLPAVRLAEVNAAIAAKDSKLLRSYATQASAQGWACAAREMLTSASAIDQKTIHGQPIAITTATSSRLELAVPIGGVSYANCDEAFAALPTEARFSVTGEPRPTLQELAQNAIATNTYDALTNAASILELPLYKGAYAVAASCLRDLADVAPPPPTPIAEMTLDELPPEWSDAVISVAMLPHDVGGWKSGGAVIFQKLRDAGYLNAARQVIETFLPPGPDASTPGDPSFSLGIHMAEGG